MSLKYFLLSILSFMLITQNIKCSVEEERLLKNLFKGYNKLIRPVKNSSEHVVITMDLVLLQLINVVCFK
jgi:nicotinic acetylcholine receptor